MSIIYKALQKTQKNRESDMIFNSQSSSEKNFPWLKAGYITAIASLAVLISGGAYLEFRHFITAKKIAAAQQQPAPAPLINEAEFKNHYILNGIFTSDQNKIAMVNNQYIHVGDAIGGMKVINIGDNDVILQNDKQIFVLRVPI